MKKPVLLFLLLLLCIASHAQKEVAVAASVDKPAILIGEPLQLRLEATFSKPHASAFFTLDSLPHFEILSRPKIDTQATGNGTTLKQTITLTSWDSGTWLIPALSIAGIKGAVTKPVALKVTFTPRPAGQDYHDIKDIIEVQKPPRTTWYWYVIGAVLLLLILLLVFPKNKKNAAPESAVHKGAYKTAITELDALKTKSIPDDKIYFTELIQTFRTYLQYGKGIHSFQQTTGELSRQLETLRLPHGDLKKLVHALQLSDFAKFAQYKATSAEREEAWMEIRKGITAIEPLQK